VLCNSYKIGEAQMLAALRQSGLDHCGMQDPLFDDQFSALYDFVSTVPGLLELRQEEAALAATLEAWGGGVSASDSGGRVSSSPALGRGVSLGIAEGGIAEGVVGTDSLSGGADSPFKYRVCDGTDILSGLPAMAVATSKSASPPPKPPPRASAPEGAPLAGAAANFPHAERPVEAKKAPVVASGARELLAATARAFAASAAASTARAAATAARATATTTTAATTTTNVTTTTASSAAAAAVSSSSSYADPRPRFYAGVTVPSPAHVPGGDAKEEEEESAMYHEQYDAFVDKISSDLSEFEGIRGLADVLGIVRAGGSRAVTGFGGSLQVPRGCLADSSPVTTALHQYLRVRITGLWESIEAAMRAGGGEGGGEESLVPFSALLMRIVECISTRVFRSVNEKCFKEMSDAFFKYTELTYITNVNVRLVQEEVSQALNNICLCHLFFYDVEDEVYFLRLPMEGFPVSLTSLLHKHRVLYTEPKRTNLNVFLPLLLAAIAFLL
jgi:hypothetical protein